MPRTQSHLQPFHSRGSRTRQIAASFATSITKATYDAASLGNLLQLPHGLPHWIVLLAPHKLDKEYIVPVLLSARPGVDARQIQAEIGKNLERLGQCSRTIVVDREAHERLPTRTHRPWRQIVGQITIGGGVAPTEGEEASFVISLILDAFREDIEIVGSSSRDTGYRRRGV
jgi:hypothetical protein